MILSTFNVENLFQRAAAMNQPTWAEGKEVLNDFVRLNNLIAQPTYTPTIKDELLKIMKNYLGLIKEGKSTFIELREARGTHLIINHNQGPAEVRVSGRDDWIGWFELVTEPIREAAIKNTARVINLVNADVQCVVEVEDRPGLAYFNKEVIPLAGGSPFDHVMLIDGNDRRGIDIGIMTRRGCSIGNVRSHVDDMDAEGVIFDRDCAEYEIQTADGNTLLVLLNHFKSKGYGSPAASARKRTRQATRARAIYDERIAEGFEYIVVAGDLNEVPDGPPLAPLVGDGVLTDIMMHPKFVGDSRPGTYGNGTKSEKLDYILMSPRLSKRVVTGGIERRGVWGGKHGDLFPHLPEIQSSVDAASDHAALWVELNL
jgi:endonuclease/exonuclease/phosphatase family metal-dependent hydrolase